MADENCGSETRKGTPCQLPAGSCPHHDDSGQPQALVDAKDDILQAARNGTTKKGCARAAGIGESTLYEWLDNFAEFAESFKRARGQAEQDLVADAKADDPKWVLERSYGYVKTERREHEHAGEGGGPIEISLNETIVETEHED